MRLLSPLFSLRAPTRALRRISSHSRRSFFASHSGVHGWRYHSPPLPYFFWRAGGNSTHSAVSSRPQWAQIWSSSLSTSAGLPLFPEEPLVPFPAPGSRLSIRSTPHPPSSSAFPHLQRPALYGPALLDEPELAVPLEALHVIDGLHAPLHPPLEDAPHAADAPRAAAAGDPERLPHRVRREPVPPAVPVKKLQDVRRRQRPHKAEVVVRRDPLGLGPDHLHAPDQRRSLLAEGVLDDLAGRLDPARSRAGFTRGRVLRHLQPPIALGD